MQKYSTLLTLISFGLMLLFSSANFKDPIPVNRWVLFKRANGVEFYIQHRSSMYDTRYNTLVRLRNTNRYEVKVSFVPSFGCDKKEEGKENNQQMQKQGRIQTAIYPRHSVTLLAYRPCKGNIPEQIVFEGLDVRQR